MRAFASVLTIVWGVALIGDSQGFQQTLQGAPWRRSVSVSKKSAYANGRTFRTCEEQAPSHRIFPTVSLSSSAEDVSDHSDKKLEREYQVASTAYALTTAVILVQNGIWKPHVLYIATGPFLGASLQSILVGAAQNDRLGSDTYKRLNLFVLEYAACSLLLFGTLLRKTLGTAGGKLPSPAYMFFGVSSLLASIPAAKGWKRGVGSNKNLMEELVGGMLESTKGLCKVQNWNAAGYLAGTIFAAGIKLSNLVELVQEIMSESMPLVGIASGVARVAKLSVVTAVLYTLKDAADRKRLNGTTFVELNFVSSLVFATMSGYWYKGSVFQFPVLAAGLLSMFTLANGVVSVRTRKLSMKKST